MKYIITAGGTGGHIYPAISIINKIKKEDKEADVLYIGTTDRMEKDIIPSLGTEYIGIKIRGLSKNPIKLAKSLYFTICGINRCSKIIKNFNPDIVIGVGGYVTFPVVYSAHKLGIKTLLHEQNSVPGKANKMLANLADTICVSMQSSIKYFKEGNVVYTGNPRGEEIVYGKKADKKDLGLDKDKKTVLITTGSLGSSSVNQKIVELIPSFKNKSYQVLLITGASSYDKIRKLNKSKNVIVVPYIEKMNEVLKITDLVISRAGATTIAELTALGIPSILIPSPYVANNHQEINAKDLEKNEACYVMLEKDFNKEELLAQIDNILNDEKEYKKISDNAKKLGNTKSATKIYEEIKKLLKNGDMNE